MQNGPAPHSHAAMLLLLGESHSTFTYSDVIEGQRYGRRYVETMSSGHKAGADRRGRRH